MELSPDAGRARPSDLGRRGQVGLGGRAQRWAILGLLSAITAITIVAIGATSTVNTDAQGTTTSAKIADAYQDARYDAVSALSDFNEFRLNQDQTMGAAALAAVTKFERTLSFLRSEPGQAGALNHLQTLTQQLVAASAHADALTKAGHLKAAARMRSQIDATARRALGELSSLADKANSESEAHLGSVRDAASKLRYATPIVLLAVLILALLFAVVLRRDRYRIATLAATDGLTGLPNRRALANVASDAIRAARHDRAPEARPALLLLDLDRFKEVNDGLGHQYGDQLLRTVAGRVRKTVSHTDTVARIGGDEFVVFMPTGGALAAEKAAGRIREALREPFSIDGIEVDLDVSIGVAAANGDLDDAAKLLRAADLAMYAAKTKGTGHVVYSDELGAGVEDKMVVVGQIRRAIDLDELVLHYQPQFSLDDRRMVGVEALLRWQHPVRGLLRPADFLPAIEDHQIIDQVTAVVLRKALRQSRAWRRLGLQVQVSVNVATRSLLNVGFPNEIAALLSEYGVEPSLLCLELTETSIMRDSDRCGRTLAALHDLGVRLSVDDYGTGYASLVYLRDLPLDEIKIDRSFVTQMTTDNQQRVLTQSVIDLGHNLGLSVVAEGVEDVDVRNALRASGCDIGQGYLFSRPLPPEEVLGWHTSMSTTALPTQRTESEQSEPV